MDLRQLRNLGIAAHIDAGKTTVTERILNVTGVERRVGRVDEGTAVMDWMAEERERGITITAAATRVTWKDAQLNLIDTPGHVDFTLEVERCMRVLDGAVLVIDAVSGVQAQSETVWRQMQRHRVPCIVFVNKCDRVGADVLAAAQSVRQRLATQAMPIQYPIYEGSVVTGVVDILRRAAWTFDAEGAAHEGEVPPRLRDEVEVLRAELVDALADDDEVLLAAVLEERDPPLDALHAALRARTLAGTLVPLLCGAALRGIGIQPLLDAIVAYLPSPLDRPPVEGFEPKSGEPVAPRAPDPEGSFTSLAFKLHAGAHGDVTFIRIYAGTLRPGQKLWNPRTRRMERPAQVRRVHADGGVALEVASAGDIVALTGMKDTATGDTLCDRADPIQLEPPEFPEPVIALIVEPSSADERDKLRQALARLAHEDPSFRVQENEQTGQWKIEGMGELHLEVQIHRLQAEFKLAPRFGQPRVSYREALAGTGRGSGRVERSLGGKDVFGAVDVEVHAAPGDHPPVVEWRPDLAIPDEFRAAIEEALLLESQSGPRFGFPLVGGRIRVVGGASHEKNDAEVAFAQAAMFALREALAQAKVLVLEPRMAFEIEAPEEFSSGIIADLGSRRAEVGDVHAVGALRTIAGKVPLAQMFGYSTVVRSLSQGRASFLMSPAGFTPVPSDELEARGLTWS